MIDDKNKKSDAYHAGVLKRLTYLNKSTLKKVTDHTMDLVRKKNSEKFANAPKLKSESIDNIAKNEYITITKQGHYMDGAKGRVFYKHSNGKINAQVMDSKGHTSTVTLKAGEYAPVSEDFKPLLPKQKELQAKIDKDNKQPKKVQAGTLAAIRNQIMGGAHVAGDCGCSNCANAKNNVPGLREDNIDEVSKDLLDRYVNKAVADHKHHVIVNNNTTNQKEKDNASKNMNKRFNGIRTAINKLDNKKVTEDNVPGMREAKENEFNANQSLANKNKSSSTNDYYSHVGNGGKKVNIIPKKPIDKKVTESIEQPSKFPLARHLTSIKKQYDDNEHINNHTENAVLLARHFGTDNEHNQAKAALAHRDKYNGYGGHHHDEMHMDNINKIHAKYYPYLKSVTSKNEAVDPGKTRVIHKKVVTDKSSEVAKKAIELAKKKTKINMQPTLIHDKGGNQ